MNAQDTTHGRIAYAFADALVSGRFDDAHAMLIRAAAKHWSAAQLAETYAGMVEYFVEPPHAAETINTMESWPDKRADDIGWAYAAINGDGDSEAVSVVVCTEDGRTLIRDIEWGRP